MVGKRTTRGQMLSHYGNTVAMRRALVAGELLDYQAAASVVAREDWSSWATADGIAFAQRVSAAAAAAQASNSLVEAAAALGALGQTCASCHLASGVPEAPVAPEEPSEARDPRMLAHAAASDRLWAGLILPSDESWASGMQLLAQTAALDNLSAEESAAMRRLSELARRGKSAEPYERGKIFGDVLSSCAGCHDRLGVAPHDAVAR